MTRALVAALAFACLLAACASRHDDGLGGAWKGVACVQRGDC